MINKQSIVPAALAVVVAGASLIVPTAVQADRDVTTQSFYRDLPVGKVYTADTPSSWGIVVLIPQIHQIPGTKSTDPKNKPAIQSQTEIRGIVDRLVTQGNADLVLLEGEPVGNVAPEKLAMIKRRVAARDAFAHHLSELEQTPTKDKALKAEIGRVVRTGKQQLNQVDRELLLYGAPFLTWAAHDTVALAGTENPKTQEEAREIMRDFYYLRDQLARVEKPATETTSLAERGDGVKLPVEQLLRIRRSASRSGFDKLERTAKQLGDTKVVSLAQELKSNARHMTQAAWQKPTDAQATGPSRADNPYRDISEPSELEERIEKNKQRLMDIALERRNIETAENTAQAMRDRGEKIAVVEFGAKHEEGLKRELQKHGLDVVVVVPESVLKH